MGVLRCTPIHVFCSSCVLSSIETSTFAFIDTGMCRLGGKSRSFGTSFRTQPSPPLDFAGLFIKLTSAHFFFYATTLDQFTEPSNRFLNGLFFANLKFYHFPLKIIAFSINPAFYAYAAALSTLEFNFLTSSRDTTRILCPACLTRNFIATRLLGSANSDHPKIESSEQHYQHRRNQFPTRSSSHRAG